MSTVSVTGGRAVGGRAVRMSLIFLALVYVSILLLAPIGGIVWTAVKSGWDVVRKLRLTLPDGQAITATVPNDKLIGVEEGQIVYVDLRNAKVFPAQGSAPAHSDELAAV